MWLLAESPVVAKTLCDMAHLLCKGLSDNYFLDLIDDLDCCQEKHKEQTTGT